jgi:hypothetical protein
VLASTIFYAVPITAPSLDCGAKAFGNKYL